MRDSSSPCLEAWQKLDCMAMALELEGPDLCGYRDTFCTSILPRIKPEWRLEDVNCHVFKSGITNTLIAFFNKNIVGALQF